MRLPYSRPWLIELADQPFCPPYLREAVQSTLTYMWTHRIRPFQARAPYEIAADVLERVLLDVQNEDIVFGESTITGIGHAEGLAESSESALAVLDLCSGAGGPVAHIERRFNTHRCSRSQPLLKFLLSDLHPPTRAWDKLVAQSPTKSLSYIPESVDASQVGLTAFSKATPNGHAVNGHAGASGRIDGIDRHLRTFFLSFHHFNDELARGVLVDAMRDAEGICIFELQEPTVGSLITIAMLFPLTLLLTPFQQPSITTLFFTYIIPLIPLLLVIDGFISAYRTRSVSHIIHLANLASLSLHLEGGDKEDDLVDWKWEYGKVRHTWPWGNMVWMVGRRDRKVCDGDGVSTEVDEGEL